MKKNIINRTLLLAMVVMLMACKTKKVAVKAPVINPAETVNSEKLKNISLLKSKDIPYNTLSLKAKASLDMNGDVNNVTMNIRIKKDQMIWVSVTAIAGLEVARAMITPDSLLLLNRLQGNYMAKPFNYIHRFANKQISFKMLQAILSGNTIGDFMTEPSQLDFTDGVWVLNGAREDLGFRILFNTLLKTAETNLNDVKSGQALKVVYSEYQKVSGALFPSDLKISSVSGTQRINIDLIFSKIESNVPLDFPFTVPKRFKVIN